MTASPTATDAPFPALRSLPGGAALGPARDLRIRPSLEIAGSRINLGCECLDRKMWDPDRGLPELGETGAKWARVQTGWSRCEETPGVYDFAWLDDVVDRVTAAGVRPWFNLTYGNRLHTGAPTHDAVGWAPVYSAPAAAAWLRFVAALVQHFRGRIDRWEIWNEPDITVFWKHELPNPLKYAELVALTAPEIRRHQSEAFIIGGAIAFGGNPRGFQYIEQFLRTGAGKHLNALSYHTYRPRPEANRPEEMAALRAMLARHQLDIEVWQGEAGCPSAQAALSALSGIPWTEAKQAKFILRRMISDIGHEVDLTSHFHLADFANYFMDGPADKPTYFGLLRHTTYARKPAFRAFQSLANLFDNQTVIDRELHVQLEVDESAPAGGHQKDWLLTHFVPCARRGLPFLAYWYPSEMNPAGGAPAFAPGRVTISLSHPLGLKMANPVLVDPITQRVHPVQAELRGFRYAIDPGRQWVFKDLPLTDHPLILCDAGAIDLLDPGCSPWFRRWRIGAPAAGEDIAALPCPVEGAQLPERRFNTTGFVNLRSDWICQTGHAVGFSSLTADEAMEVEVLAGYDGPFRLWIDGAEVIGDAAGTKAVGPGADLVPDARVARLRLAAGEHRVTVAMGLRQGKATGFCLRLRRVGGGTDAEAPRPWA